MSPATFLAVGAGVLVLLELLTLDFTLLMLALGFLVTSGALAIGARDNVAGIIGLVTTVLSLGFLRPIALRTFRRGPSIATGTDALLGASGTAMTDVTADGGQVKLRGEIWSARSHDGQTIALGAVVDVVAIEGATAVVVPQ